MTVSAQELICFNGVDAATGKYGIQPVSSEELSVMLQAGVIPGDDLAELKSRRQQTAEQHLGVKEGVDPRNLAETGWGVVFAHDAAPSIQEALGELLALRQKQAGQYFKVFAGENGYRPNETKSRFLARHGVGPGPSDPEKMPYYLLLVGNPDAIPYQFQYQLDVQYAVGRIGFDSPEDYANYAHSVASAEMGKKRLPRRAGFFAVSNPDDQATYLAREYLVEPLLADLQAARRDWEFNLVANSMATKSQLGQLLGGDQTPSLLFTASHGMGFPSNHALQRKHQGALLCQDWPGPQKWQRAIPPDFYFAGDDVPSNASLLGLIAFCFACYGAGTPLYDEYSMRTSDQRRALAPAPFVAGLPQKLLSHPRGGALAVIGHIDRAWGYSFNWPGADAQTTVFVSALERLLKGYPVGAALEFFNQRYAELASDLSAELEEIDYGKQVDPRELAGMWTANNDARSYAIIGDPAVRVLVAADDENGSHTATGKRSTQHRATARRHLTLDSAGTQREHIRDHHPAPIRRRMANRRRI